MLTHKNTPNKLKHNTINTPTTKLSTKFHNTKRLTSTRSQTRKMATLTNISAKILQKRKDAEATRPYNVKSLLTFTGGDQNEIMDVSKPFHYKSAAMEYTIIPQSQINNDDVHNYVLSNLQKVDKKKDDNDEEPQQQQVATIAFITEKG
jgi:hypothetical protein